LVTQYHDPLFPAGEGTPVKFAVHDRTGKHIQTIHDRLTPVAHGGLLDPDRVTPGPRQIGWHPNRPARLHWFEQVTEAATGDDTGADEIYVLDAPFSGKPRRIYRSDHRIQDVFWLPQEGFLAYENRIGSGTSRLVRVAQSSGRVTTLIDYPEPPEGAVIPRLFPFNHPRPILATNARGHVIPFLSSDKRYVYMATFDGSGLQRLNLASGQVEPVTKAAGAFVQFLDDKASSALFLREEPGTGGVLVASDLLSGEETTLVRFPRRNLLPETIVPQVIESERKDGLPLRATVRLPEGWSKSEGPLPAVLWVYALRYQSTEEYETDLRRRASTRFTEEQDFILDMRILSLAGYAVVTFNPPVVPANPGQSPHESGWNEQIVAGAKAIIDELAARGMVDPQRVAVGGQSGGGHTAASLVAHSNLFRAGIVCNGLYNRTLSPFGVSLYEERSLWEVPQVYFEMSPLFYADKVAAPLLIMKGQDENHPSIHPAESANLFGALQGLGKTVRYVEFPFESHANVAYESVLHQLWEIERWLGLHIGQGWMPGQATTREAATDYRR
jgi:dipeptidyl aminopeptidase/acylaminoacyl peptidase